MGRSARMGVVPTLARWSDCDEVDVLEVAPRILVTVPDPRVSRNPYNYSWGASDPRLRPTIRDERD